LNRFIVVDFETTGSHPRQGDSIIQIGAVTVDDGEITECYSTLVNPGQPIPSFITSLTGISDEMVADAPTIEEVLPDLLRMLDGRTFVAHNASFDLLFLQEALHSQGYYTFDGYVLDTVELSRFLLPMQGSYRLAELADDLEIEHENPHQADSDAMATANLLLKLLKILGGLPLITLQRLQLLVASFRSDISVLLSHMEMEKLMQVSFAAEQGAASPDEENWDVYRGLALRIRQPEVRAQAAREPVYPAELDVFLEGVLRERGTLAQVNERYQYREAQEAMIRAVYAAMNDGAHLLVEAGTGTGKSLGYLLPTLLWSKWHQQQAVVSTHTIHLQDQLFHKDIPMLQAALPFSFTAARLKGRSNYLCLRKFEQSLEETGEGASHELRLTKAQMVTWLTQTETGDVEEVSLPPAGEVLWQQVKSDANSCLHRNCPWFTRCYYFQAKERAKDADVLIVNHALLLSDLQAESRILPRYEVAVIDEAHQLEDVASQQFGVQFSSAGLSNLLDRLAVDQEQGVPQRLADELGSWQPELREQAAAGLADLAERQLAAREGFHQWIRSFTDWAVKHAKDATETGRATVRFRASDFAGRQQRIVGKAKETIEQLGLLAGAAEQLLGLVKEQSEQPPFAVRSLATNLEGILDDLQQRMDILHFLFLSEQPDYVCWAEVEIRTTRKQLYLFAAPLDVSGSLAEQLFADRRSITLTSATLTVKDSFAHIIERYGLSRLPGERVRTLSLPSPFDYEQQGLILIPSDFPSLGKETEGVYLEAVTQGCADLVRAANGRTLILFTSYAMLRQVYDGLKEQLADENYRLLGHGIDSGNRSKLVRMFQREPKAVLLGNSSFWEGVDIPGEALSCLVIVRLPFQPPNLPLLEGRYEKVKAEQKNPFMTLSLPHAVIRFKQGIGRLIRQQSDRGVIAVFDARIVESRYGRAFLQSLPPFRIETGKWTQLRELVRPFLYSMHPHADS
jgi:ATP-dependent DNA helicase DinG